MTIIDMQAMRYINLLDKVSRVKTRRCFIHNDTIFFAVNKHLVSKAIGSAAINIKKIQEQIGKKVKVIKEAEGLGDAKRFIEDIVSPGKIKNLEIRDNILVITSSNNQNKASLIGRNKRRYEELKKIVMDTFGKELKIL